MIEEIKLRVAIWFLYAIGLIARTFTKDPLADFFDEMERTGRLKIEDDDEPHRR